MYNNNNIHILQIFTNKNEFNAFTFNSVTVGVGVGSRC